MYWITTLVIKELINFSLKLEQIGSNPQSELNTEEKVYLVDFEKHDLFDIPKVEKAIWEGKIMEWINKRRI